MQDAAVPINRLVAWTLWGVVGCLLLAAWLVTAFASHAYGFLLAITACAISAAAAVAQLRCYIQRAVRVVLAAMAEQGGAPRPKVRSMRP